jgi:hypothetical protein
MPAKKRDESIYKSFLGRIFTLRKHKQIPGFRNLKSKKEFFSIDDIGEAVIILDETNSRVKVYCSNGGNIWIPKFFLHNEIKGNDFQILDSITECISEILNLTEEINNKEKYFNNQKRLHNIAFSLRGIADTIKVKPSKLNVDERKKYINYGRK